MKSSPYFWLPLHRTQVRWRLRKILWPSQNVWTLPFHKWDYFVKSYLVYVNSKTTLKSFWLHRRPNDFTKEQKCLITFFVCFRAHFNYNNPEKSEMSFNKSDVFHVVDTLHNGVVGSWQAFRMGKWNHQSSFSSYEEIYQES